MATSVKRKAALHGVLHGVEWAEYKRYLRMYADRPGIRLTYDRGTLELMSPSLTHDDDSSFLSQAVVVWHLDRNIPYRSGRSVTLRNRRLLRGVEPDDCFWLARYTEMIGVRDLDLRIHPPPDLVIEIDHTNSAVPRFPIYAALGVPEIWHAVRGQLAFLVLRDGEYQSVDVSEQVPGLTLADLSRFYAETIAGNPFATIVRFRDWRSTLP